MSPSQEAAAWHGLAINVAFSIEERLACALKALDWYERLGAVACQLAQARDHHEVDDAVIKIMNMVEEMQ